MTEYEEDEEVEEDDFDEEVFQRYPDQQTQEKSCSHDISEMQGSCESSEMQQASCESSEVQQVSCESSQVQQVSQKGGKIIEEN